LDLSGSFQGAGGVGGLLFAKLHLATSTSTHAASCDGNGNVLAYYDAATGERTARFEYGPFGEPLVDDGPAAENLTYRFSTKPRDPLTGTYYYGYRHYVPTTGRWLSGDPIEEEGGINLYGFVENDPASNVDSLGLEPVVDPRLPGGFRDSKTGRATKDHRKGIEKRGKAFEKALRYAYDKYSEAARQSFVDRGRQACESQARLRGTCGKCCVIDIFWVPSGPELENKVYFYAGAFLANEACTIARQRIERYGVIRTPRPRMATDDTVYLDW
jgi:RHS repeat-associated protein